MNLRCILPLLVTVSLLVACATTPLAPGCIRLGHNGQFCPLPPAALPTLSASHIVTVTHRGRSQTFLGRLQIDAHALRLAGLSLFGAELFTLDYDGRNLSSHAVRGNLHSELLLAMLELTLAPPAELRPQLRGLTLSVTDSGGTQVRELFERDHLIARIGKTTGPPATARIHIEIPPAKLALQLTPLAAKGRAP